MKKDKPNSEMLAEFRRRAEKRLQKLNIEPLQKLSPHDAERFMQEFQMPQFKLEMQNEELRRTGLVRMMPTLGRTPSESTKTPLLPLTTIPHYLLD